MTGTAAASTTPGPISPSDSALLRIGSISSVLGLVVGGVTIYFHGGMQPENLQVVLPQYAANEHWELVHFVQFVADMLLLVGFVALYRSITAVTTGVSAIFARLGIIVAVVAEAIYGANQAVDGVAIKFVAKQWVNASAAEKADALRVADAVRHIEIGLSSVWTLSGGIALLLFGLAIALGCTYPKALGWTAIVIGVLQIANSFNLAHHGFVVSPLGLAGLLIVPWTLALAACLWGKAERFRRGHIA